MTKPTPWTAEQWLEEAIRSEEIYKLSSPCDPARSYFKAEMEYAFERACMEEPES